MEVINNFLEVANMPQVALLSSTDPLLESMTELLSLLEVRLQSGEGLDSLDAWLGQLF